MSKAHGILGWKIWKDVIFEVFTKPIVYVHLIRFLGLIMAVISIIYYSVASTIQRYFLWVTITLGYAIWFDKYFRKLLLSKFDKNYNL